MGPKKYKTEEERKQAKAEQDKLRYENINQKEAASAQNGDISARAKRLQKIAASQRKRRLDESLEVQVKRLNQDAESHRRQRENESELETAARRENDRQIHIRRHQNQSINLRRHRQQSADLVTEDENSVVEHTCGLMSVICLYCESHNFLAERPLDG
ncbi:hypothetical protein LAZ67_13000032 [Cordylochernes scorpioides]|uniref:Uncharacterized protein n=1 Tax=Cordylochernes scorpioides TaxID=51811 RepID=A0ABY6L594_9ARAC|nr:hypothetical protein LAZ67_13000032 [Cordylochernes scorpioides]